MLVRVTAVSGVCRVLSLFFELIPFPVMKTLLGRLVKELVWDASAIDVRVAVLQVRGGGGPSVLSISSILL